MILIDETKLTNGIIEMIGECYGMKCNCQDNKELYQKFLDRVIDRFAFKKEQFNIKGN